MVCRSRGNGRIGVHGPLGYVNLMSEFAFEFPAMDFERKRGAGVNVRGMSDIVLVPGNSRMVVFM